MIYIILSLIAIVLFLFLVPDLLSYRFYGYSKEKIEEFSKKDLSNYNIYLSSNNSNKFWILSDAECEDFISDNGGFASKYHSHKYGLIPRSHPMTKKIDEILADIRKQPGTPLTSILNEQNSIE